MTDARAADLLSPSVLFLYYVRWRGEVFAPSQEFSCRWEEAKLDGPCFSPALVPQPRSLARSLTPFRTTKREGVI